MMIAMMMIIYININLNVPVLTAETKQLNKIQLVHGRR